MTLQFKLQSFEGPMDLLLHLVGQRKVSIEDVPILALIEQYLEVVQQWTDSDLEIQADFLEMAARLVFIKSSALLPKHREPDLAEELRQELLNYRDCQYLAEQLNQRSRGFDYIARGPTAFPQDYTYRLKHKSRVLFAPYLAAIGKGKRRLPPPVEAFSGIVAHAIVSVSSRCHFLVDRLRLRKRMPLQALLEESRSRSEMVATFLAALSMVHAKRLLAFGSGTAAMLELQTDEKEWREIDEE
jgi:segregation and condensation protein A